MRFIIASVVVSALALTSCESRLSERQTAEAHDVAIDAAYQAIGESAHVAQLEARIQRLERRVQDLESRGS